MKNLEEKKLLVKMARMLGEPVDPELLESIKREEQLTEALFGKKNEEPVLVEVVPEPVEEIVVEAIIEPLPSQEEKPAETGVQRLTANVFTFGITNNSGTSQVVNWGYTTL